MKLQKSWITALAAALAIGGGTVARATLLAQANDATETRSDDDHGSETRGFSIGGRASRFIGTGAAPDRWMGGAQARAWSRVFGLEGSFDFYKSASSDNLRVFPLQASLLARIIPDSRFNPFLLGGVGWYFQEASAVAGTPFEGTNNRFGLHAGGGVEVYLNSTWSLDATYRFVWLETLDSKGRSLFDKDYSGIGHMITAGLNFHF